MGGVASAEMLGRVLDLTVPLAELGRTFYGACGTAYLQLLVCIDYAPEVLRGKHVKEIQNGRTEA